jgi:hypothetical protein
MFAKFAEAGHCVDWDRLQEPELSPIPSHLQQLTIRVEVSIKENTKNHPTHLPSAANVINAVASSLQHLTIEIELDVRHSASFLALVDFSPLAVLGTAPSLSIPRIDLYVHTDTLQATTTLGSCCLLWKPTTT